MAPEIIFPYLNIVIEKLNKVAFRIFDIDIYWYGIIITSAIIIGLLLVEDRVKKTNQNVEKYYEFTIFAVIMSIIGARLYFVIFSWDTYKDNIWKVFNLREGGIAIYGAIIFGVLATVIFAKLNKMKFSVIVDTCAPSLILGQAIGRWGNFFNKEAFGSFTNGLFAMALRRDTLTYIPKQLEGMNVIYNNATYLQVHPTFLYESVWNLIVFILLINYRNHKRYDGEVFVLYIIGYALGRVWIEGLRTDQLLIGSSNLAISQILSFILLIIAIAYEIYRIFDKKRLTKNG